VSATKHIYLEKLKQFKEMRLSKLLDCYFLGQYYDHYFSRNLKKFLEEVLDFLHNPILHLIISSAKIAAFKVKIAIF
jgi:hypothetical protein